MPLLNTCQFCGAQSTTLEAYFIWTICSSCAATLRAPQSARASAETTEEPRRQKRARCNFCGNLKERAALHKFTGARPRDYVRGELHGRLVCERCEQFLRAPCRTHPDLGGSSEQFRAAKASYDALAEVAL